MKAPRRAVEIKHGSLAIGPLRCQCRRHLIRHGDEKQSDWRMKRRRARGPVQGNRLGSGRSGPARRPRPIMASAGQADQGAGCIAHRENRLRLGRPGAARETVATGKAAPGSQQVHTSALVLTADFDASGADFGT